MADDLNKFLKKHSQDKLFITLIGIVGTVVLCALDFWVFAMMFAFAVSMFVIALWFKLV